LNQEINIKLYLWLNICLSKFYGTVEGEILIEFNIGLEQVRKKLLDLSKRNRLINYRRPHKSKNVKFIDESPEFIYKFLVNDEKSFKFKSIPYPNQMPEYLKLIDARKNIEKIELPTLELAKREVFVAQQWATGEEFRPVNRGYFSSNILESFKVHAQKKSKLNAELNGLNEKIEKMESDESFSIESQAKALGLVVSLQMPEIELSDENNFDIHIDEHLQTLHYTDELEKILKNIELQSRTIMDVTGSNMLYLLLGVLEWREESKPEVVIKSPLITVPVSLKRMALDKETNTYEYTLSYTGDIIETNESLSQKLFNDFGVKLPTLTEEVSFNNYIREVEKLCQRQNHWKIKQEISLDFLQFGKVLMYKDLRDTETLEKHTVLQDIFLGRIENKNGYALKEYDIDRETRKKRMPLVLDADSSQHSAMIDVLKGKNVVIEGPPGTGKSQIIANLIALLMNEGKKVLFVSEKLVALEVVHQRLEQVGLGDFCMELHSHKTDKVEFLKNLNKRIVGEYGFPLNYDKTEENLVLVKQQLTGYLDILHQTYGNNNKSIFENIWLRENYLEGEQYFLFKITNAKRLSPKNLHYCEEHLNEYETHYADYNLSDSFWVGFEVADLSFLENSKFFNLLSQLKEAYFKITEELRDFGVEEGEDEVVAVEKLQKFVDDFRPIEKHYFPFSELSGFQNLHKKLKGYLHSLLVYIDTSEINRFSTAEILDAVETSANILEELSEIESEIKPEVIAFKRFIAQAKKSHHEFELLEKNNSENLYLPIVNEKTPEDIYKVVHTIQEKRDSWFRFLSPSYKKAKRSFSLLLKEQLPDDAEAWTFLLRELNIYVLNRENQLQLRLTLIDKVPIFIKRIESIDSEIGKTLEIYEEVHKSSIEQGFKAVLFNDTKNVEQFSSILKRANEIKQIHKALESYGTIEESFWKESHRSFELRALKLQELENNKDSLSLWINFQRLLNKLKDLGLKEMMKSAERKEIPKDKLIEVFYFNYYNSLLNEALLEFPVLEKFSRVKHDALVKKFQELDKKYIYQSRRYIADKLSEKKLPPANGTGRVGTFTNLKLLKHEISKKRRHVPIRQLLKRAGGAIHALKPCFMMSPLSVAQYIPMEREPTFDVLLIDEASQMKPEESLGVIARAKQVVVVGDPKQMPPSSFFDVIQEEIEGEKKTLLDDSESILDSFIELYSPIRRLKWHYRSQHESLIAFSNRHFYDNELTIFPSTSSQVDERFGVKYTYVDDGVYRSGNQYRVNIIEAQRVLDQVKYQMEFFPETSLGVGTLNGTQQELIQELVDEAEKEFGYVSRYIEKWKDKNEAFFVKNLESLQGDERDVILISTTYGKEEGSDKVAQRFGPINQESGWRRLNVLITRSKQKMHVFTSMLSSDIRVSDGSSRGLKALKNFLKFLEHNETKQPQEHEVEELSIFSKILYKLLTDKGYTVVQGLGISGYHIDLAVVSKKDGSYILAIECDGEEYVYANSTSDRERLKIEALERLGWNHYRLWSMEWYKNREIELKRLMVTIEACEKNLDKHIKPQ